MSKIVVYTAIADAYDLLKEPPAGLQNGVDWVAFCERAPSKTSWQIRKICTEFADPCRNAKKHKILAHTFFPEAAYSLWIDGSVKLGAGFSIHQLIDEHLREHDLMVFKHPERQCIYEEAEACIRMKRDDPEIIRKQMAAYRQDNYPSSHGLVESGILLRRHTEQIRQFNEAWYQEIKNNSRRDQLSFNYMAHKTGLNFGCLPESLRSGTGRWFQVMPHWQFQHWHLLHKRKKLANLFLLGFAILALAWVLLELALIFEDVNRHSPFSVFSRLGLLALVSLGGIGICWFWRSSLKRKIREAKPAVVKFSRSFEAPKTS